ncbi:hypothetical protein [Rhodoflexus caldus]|uniref:hypothetical protein n=1 Tax=Rhodoflexus caldus TaxID=2891236 RepID=UPI002029C93D|nr:hypothetical protein [Rhodoflexus caldus]
MSAYLELLIALILITLLFRLIRKQSVKVVFIITVLLSLLLRWWLIWFTPELNTNIDLLMYMDGGQLTAMGINPYDYNDSKEIRNQLRKDDYAYQEYTAQSQDIWNYCAASHLPLTQFNLALAYKLFYYPEGFRYYFAFFDSILCGLICLFIIRNWKSNDETKFFANLILGICSPFLISWSIVNPGDKGTETLLILAFLLSISSNSKTIFLYVSALFMGLGIAYKAVAAFFIPLAIQKFWEVKSDLHSFFRMLFIFGIISFLIVALSFLPFVPEVLYPMTQRFEHGSAAIYPMHSSIWRVFYILFPENWRIIQILSVAMLTIFSSYNAFKDKIVDLLCANLLWIFTVMILITSGVDRMNMAFIPSILIACKYCSERQSFILLFIYAITGLIILFYPLVKNILALEGLLGDVNFAESLMCLLLTIVYFSIVSSLKSSYVPQPSRNH